MGIEETLLGLGIGGEGRERKEEERRVLAIAIFLSFPTSSSFSRFNGRVFFFPGIFFIHERWTFTKMPSHCQLGSGWLFVHRSIPDIDQVGLTCGWQFPTQVISWLGWVRVEIQKGQHYKMLLLSFRILYFSFQNIAMYFFTPLFHGQCDSVSHLFWLVKLMGKNHTIFTQLTQQFFHT